MTDHLDLDDADAVLAADVDGLLHRSALAGAAVRAVAQAVAEGVVQPLTASRPRSVVIVCGDADARAGAQVVVAALAPVMDVPMVIANAAPLWLGPLDVVVIIGDDAGHRQLVDATSLGTRRGAEVVVAAPVEGPMSAAVEGPFVDLSPRLRVAPTTTFFHSVAVVIAVATALTSVQRNGFDGVSDLDEMAEALDTEAQRGHPSRDSVSNSAKVLAAKCHRTPTVLAGDTEAAVALAAHAATRLLSIAAMVCGATSLADLLHSSQRWAAPTQQIDPLFYDPEIDPPTAVTPVSAHVVTTPRREWLVHKQIDAIRSVSGRLVVSALSADPATEPAEKHLPESVDDATRDVPLDVLPLVVQALRIEMAAVYLRLTEGS